MRRVINYLAGAVLLCAAYGCSGGGGGSLPATPATAPLQQQQQQPQPITPSTTGDSLTPMSVTLTSPTSWSHMTSTASRVGLIQSFDYTGSGASNAWITNDASRYSSVWASVYPRIWSAAHPGMMVSDYFILGLDRKMITGRDITWFRANHPDWILYSCTSSGAPTHDVAYMKGIPDGEVPLDIHNPAVVDYQIRQTMGADAIRRGYNTLAVDQVVFWNTYGIGTEFGCGTWSGNTFVRRYTNVNDPHFATDVANYVRSARTIAHSIGLSLAVNHPVGNISDPNQQTVLSNVDLDIDETGFSDYGHYASNAGNFGRTLSFLTYAQHHGTAVGTLNRFSGITAIAPIQMDYVMAGYFMANEGAELIFAGVDHTGNNNGEQYHSEYGTQLGTPCSDATGGPVYVRRFSKGMVIVNSSSVSASVPLPATGFRDIEGRSVTNPLHLNGSDGYVLLGPGGC